MTPGSDPPDVSDLLRRLHVVVIPMRVPFRGVTHREIALLEGPAGWGEFAPFVEYAAPEASRWLASAIESAYGQWPAPLRAAISVNATVPAVPAAAVEAILTRFPGCTTAKVKVAEPGHTLADDLDRVAAVRAILGPAARIRVDANGAWRPAEAVAALRRLAAYGLDYAEEPCASVAELRELRLALARARVEVRIAADESIRKAGDPLLVARREAADLIVVKVAPLGGVAHALTIVADCGLPAVVSSALDTSVGISAGVALAAALPALDGACGLGTVALLDGDVTRRPLTPVAGMLRPGRVTVDRELLRAYAAEQARVRWWQDRVRACWAELPPHRQG